MNSTCKCGGRILPVSRKVCCATNKSWMVFKCGTCNRSYEQALRLPHTTVVQPELVGTKGFYHYEPYSYTERPRKSFYISPSTIGY